MIKLTPEEEATLKRRQRLRAETFKFQARVGKDWDLPPKAKRGDKLDRISSAWQTGTKQRTDSTCRNCVPPWEVCPKGCPLSTDNCLEGEREPCQKYPPSQLSVLG